MNNDKTLRAKFIENEDYPAWYFYELKEIEVDYVIWNLLKETFIVEIDGNKHEITFGKNRKNEIGQCIKYNDIKSSGLTSYNLIQKGFKDGKWFSISNTETTEEVKEEYCKRKAQYAQDEKEKFHKGTLKRIIEGKDDMDADTKTALLLEIDNSSPEKLEETFNQIKWK